MGYTTEFYGNVNVDPPLNATEIEYLRRFAGTRRMDRERGPYMVDGNGFMGQDDGPDTIPDYNRPPKGQPGLWCQWVPGHKYTGDPYPYTCEDDGSIIEWDGGEKFYNATEWMGYIIDHFLRPGAVAQTAAQGTPEWDLYFQHFTFDHILNGEIEAQGEDREDIWLLVVKDNEVSVRNGRIVYDDPDQ